MSDFSLGFVLGILVFISISGLREFISASTYLAARGGASSSLAKSERSSVYGESKDANWHMLESLYEREVLGEED